MYKLYRVLGKHGRITIPFDIRQRIGFSTNDILSFTETDDGRAVLIRHEKICDNCKSIQPDLDSGTASLFDFLNGLTSEQQRSALVHLSLLWAQKESNDVNVDV